MFSMKDLLTADTGQDARRIELVDLKHFDLWREGLSERSASAVKAANLTAKAGKHAVIHSRDQDWHIAAVVEDAQADPFALAGLPAQLPPGEYRLDGQYSDLALLGWALGQYKFDRYLADEEREARTLVVAEDIANSMGRLASAHALVRDLVNTPAEDLGPAELEERVREEASRFGAEVRSIVGDDLLSEKYPAVHAVGRAADDKRAPRMIEMNWGKSGHPRISIIGKGVCFDSGGLDVKSASGMRLMKKDMGGAAHALALARLIMEEGLPVRVQLLIPAVENSISANALRPGDVIDTRAGKMVEIGNTDAEGRLILCDALALAGESKPKLIIDFATLTGAARVALGPDLPALFVNDEELAKELLEAGDAVGDPLWRMPLWQDYVRLLKSEIADINNAASGSFAGAITAALYMQQFVPPEIPWAHFDTFAWVPSARPGRPVGGEALGLRAAFAALKARFTG